GRRGRRRGTRAQGVGAPERRRSSPAEPETAAAAARAAVDHHRKERPFLTLHLGSEVEQLARHLREHNALLCCRYGKRSVRAVTRVTRNRDNIATRPSCARVTRRASRSSGQVPSHTAPTRRVSLAVSVSSPVDARLLAVPARAHRAPGARSVLRAVEE